MESLIMSLFVEAVEALAPSPAKNLSKRSCRLDMNGEHAREESGGGGTVLNCRSRESVKCCCIPPRVVSIESSCRVLHLSSLLSSCLSSVRVYGDVVADIGTAERKDDIAGGDKPRILATIDCSCRDDDISNDAPLPSRAARMVLPPSPTPAISLLQILLTVEPMWR